MRNPPSTSTPGFTMIEMVGVLAVISILAATIAPSAIQMITSSKQTAEDGSLTSISDALRLYVQRNKKVPNQTTWATDLASLLNTSPNKVSTNGNSGQRIYLYPDNFFATGSSLAYDQYANVVADANGGAINTLLTSVPANGRVMVISNLNSGTPLAQASGQLAATTFDNIWNQSGSFAAELTEGDMLKIARINISDLFEQLILNNNDASANASYQISGVTMPVIAAGSQVTLELIKTTQVSLLDSYGSIYNRQVVSAPTSFSYLSNWGGTLGATGGTTTTSAAIASAFSGTNGALADWKPKPSCTAAKAALVIDNKTGGKVTDYNVFSGDASGAIVDRDRGKKGDVTYFGGPGASAPGGYKLNGQSVSKTRNASAFNTCDLVVVVPKANNGNQVNVYIFYMPTTASESAPYEITVP